MDDKTLASLAGVVLSLAFSYVPGLQSWYVELKGEYKRLLMLVVLGLVALGMYAASRTGWSASVSCDGAGAKQLVSLFITAVIANQAAYLISPQQKA